MNKSLKNVKFCGYATANERGWKEVKIEYYPTFIESILKKSGKKFTFVSQFGNVWFHKDTFDEASGWYSTIRSVIRMTEYNGSDWDITKMYDMTKVYK